MGGPVGSKKEVPVMSSSPMSPLGERLRAAKQKKRKIAFISAIALGAAFLIVALLIWHKANRDSAASKDAAQSNATEAPADAGQRFDTPEKQDEIVRKLFTLCTSGKKFDAACVLDNGEPLCPSRPTTELEVVGQSCGEDRACWQDFLRSCGAFPQKGAEAP
jgi:hypothetical protein